MNFSQKDRKWFARPSKFAKRMFLMLGGVTMMGIGLFYLLSA